jgi:hypothetical protein
LLVYRLYIYTLCHLFVHSFICLLLLLAAAVAAVVALLLLLQTNANVEYVTNMRDVAALEALTMEG